MIKYKPINHCIVKIQPFAACTKYDRTILNIAQRIVRFPLTFPHFDKFSTYSVDVMITSTRRFRSRPSGVRLLAMGDKKPIPSAAN